MPVESAVEAVRSGAQPQLTTRQKHTRECFVVAKEGADKAAIEKAIVTMPDYFADYDTTVHFISQEELNAKHKGLPHGGSVIRSGRTGWNKEDTELIEFRLKLDSNPEFTSCILAAYARAVFRLASEGATGARTILDIPLAYTSPLPQDELIAAMVSRTIRDGSPGAVFVDRFSAAYGCLSDTSRALTGAPPSGSKLCRRPQSLVLACQSLRTGFPDSPPGNHTAAT